MFTYIRIQTGLEEFSTSALAVDSPISGLCEPIDEDEVDEIMAVVNKILEKRKVS